MATSEVLKVSTFKSGSFVFSYKFDPAQLEYLLLEARVLHDTLFALPIAPDLATSLDQEALRRSVFGTAAIEGNPLQEAEVSSILSGSGRTTTREDSQREIENISSVYENIRELKHTDSPALLAEKDVLKLHRMMTEGIQYDRNIPGAYRRHRVQVGTERHGGVYTPPKMFEDIETLMKAFIQWINSAPLLQLEPVLRAALAHYHLALIHPFADGNGRTCRAVEARLLILAGRKYAPVMIWNSYYQRIDEYFSVFSTTRRNKVNDVTAFLEFFLDCFIDALGEVRDRMAFFMRIFGLRHYFALRRKSRSLTERRYDLLIMLLDNLGPFELNDLFEKSPLSVLYKGVSRKAAKRDLTKLLEGGLLLKGERGYTLNQEAIG